MAVSTEKDHLTALPPELIHHIVSYIFPTHRPDLAWHLDELNAEKAHSSSGCHHTLDYLAGTCKGLRSSVKDWAETFLRQHREITKYSTTASKRKGKPRDKWLRGGGGLLWWTERHCVFCGRPSKRLAVFMNGFKCCKDCDRDQWPDKMTKTEACDQYDLTDRHLLPHKEMKQRISAKTLAKIPSGLPKLRYGTTILASNVPPTTYFLRRDVKRLAKLAHGDLKAHLKQRKAEKEERSRKIWRARGFEWSEERRRWGHTSLPRRPTQRARHTQAKINMDWTGGTRRRFASKKNNAVAQRQKAHFARARAGLNAPPQHTMTQSAHGRSATQSIRPTAHSRGNHSERRHSERGSLDRCADAGKTTAHGAGEDAGRTRYLERSSRSIIPVRSHDRSSVESARNQATAAKLQLVPLTMITSIDGMSEEKRLLLANRRRLLDRGDWLGLAQVQLPSMKFSSLHDRDQIGKRRRVEKSRPNRDNSCEPRLLTPAFEGRLRHQDFVMSGALPRDDFHIKIGTDALATQTQTQASNRSYVLANTSMRPPSAELESLSEESMLLDADEEHFDPLPVSDGDAVPAEHTHFQTQHVCEVRNMGRAQYEVLAPDSQRSQEEQPNKMHSDDEGYGQRIDVEGMHEGRTHEHEGEKQDRDCDFVTESQKTPSQDSITSTPLEKDDSVQHVLMQIETDTDQDDDIWRRFLDVVQQIPSNASTKAVKSSSLHVTSSGDNVRPVAVHEDPANTFIAHQAIPSRGAGPHRSANDVQKSQSRYQEKLSSPCASLNRITNLANQRPPNPLEAQQDNQEDALWREFVCGAQEDSDTLSEILRVDQRSDEAAPNVSTAVPASSSYMVSDLGTSNKTTIGDDTLVVESTVAANETDEIEDEVIALAQEAKSRNIHTTRTLNPKRFLPAPKRQRAPPRRASRFLPSGHVQTTASKAGRSIFDPVDSDGNSLA